MKTTWPKRIPRDRAIAALELAGQVLDQEQDLDPQVEPGDNFETVTLAVEKWEGFVDRARLAVGGLSCVESRPLPALPAGPDYDEALQAFLDRPVAGAGLLVAFEAGWNAGRRRRSP